MEAAGLQPSVVHYRPAGRGQQTRRALVAAAALPDFCIWLEAALGSPLALFTVTQPAAPKPVAKTDPFGDLVRVEIRNTDDIPFDIPRVSVVPDDEPLEPAQVFALAAAALQLAQRGPAAECSLRRSC
jgi:hypothetical protein